MILRLLAAALAVVFVVAAVAKGRDLDATAREFASLGISRPRVVALLLVPLELAVAVALIAAPPVGATVAFAVLAAFTTVLVGVVRSGRLATCRCFGALSSRPVSNVTLVRNGGLLAVAAVVALG